MQKNQLSRKGITLVEVLIVMGIIATVSGILWMVLAPKALRSARTAAITGGLKQAAAGLAIYRGDNNDAFPGKWQEFGFSRPNSPDLIRQGAVKILDNPPSYPESWRTEEGAGKTQLSYSYNRTVQSNVTQYVPKYPFDDQLYPVFVAPFFTRLADAHGHLWMFAPPKMRIFTGSGETYKVYDSLRAFTDGHVKWGPTIEIWEKEYMYHNSYGDL